MRFAFPQNWGPTFCGFLPRFAFFWCFPHPSQPSCTLWVSRLPACHADCCRAAASPACRHFFPSLPSTWKQRALVSSLGFIQPASIPPRLHCRSVAVCAQFTHPGLHPPPPTLLHCRCSTCGLTPPSATSPSPPTTAAAAGAETACARPSGLLLYRCSVLTSAMCNLPFIREAAPCKGAFAVLRIKQAGSLSL